jgi:hypothetical protein
MTGIPIVEFKDLSLIYQDAEAAKYYILIQEKDTEALLKRFNKNTMLDQTLFAGRPEELI